jgi:acylphosphatase
MSERATRHLVVRGGVQGVGYRFSMVNEARRLGVNGWVRNRRDGSVEAVVQGPPDALTQLIAWARRGPPSAAVESVEVEDVANAEPYAGFHTAPTQ